jgi:hypothetical protein
MPTRLRGMRGAAPYDGRRLCARACASFHTPPSMRDIIVYKQCDVSTRISSPRPPSQQSERTLAARAVQLQPRQFRGKGIHVHLRILQPRVEIWMLSSYWPSHFDRKRISLAISRQPANSTQLVTLSLQIEYTM